MQLITGIHHVTAIAGDSQRNLEFYAGILGLRLVKKTVNFDAPDVYHFYYGDETGNPGSILTFFPYGSLMNGRHGKGMLNTTAFSVPANSLEFWLTRLKKYNVAVKEQSGRFDEELVYYFEDVDGLGLELVFNNKDKRKGITTSTIPEEFSIRGFYGVEIWQDGYERTGALLTEQLDHKLIAEKGNRFRFAAGDNPGNYVDIVCTPESLKGLAGNGTVHHIAFATKNEETQLEVRQKIAQRMLNPTPVLDRNYFTSIYFREPGGVLFEVATEGPGFGIDESVETLGEALKLPEQYEQYRSQLETSLPVIHLDKSKFI